MLSPAPATTVGALLRVPEPPPGAARSLEAGQTLTAVARSAARDGGLELQLGRQVVQARTDQPIQAGDRLQVQVVRQNSDSLALRILAPERSQPATEAMRGLMSRQGDPSGLLANVARAASSPETVRSLPEPVQQALRQLWQALPDRTQVSRPDGLRQAVADNGLQLEQRLAGIAAGRDNPGAARSDQKLQLVNLLNQITRSLDARPAPGGNREMPSLPGTQARATPPPAPQQATLANLNTAAEALADLSRQADGALARTQLSQVALLSGEPLALFFELPVRDEQQVDLLQFRLESGGGDGEGAESGERTWRVMVSFHFERLGPMHAAIHLSGDAVAATWWAEEPATVRFLEGHLETLEQRFQDLGLRVASLTCAEGRPPEPESSGPGTSWQGVIHERA